MWHSATFFIYNLKKNILTLWAKVSIIQKLIIKSGERNDKKNLSTKKTPPSKSSWFPSKDENPRWQKCFETQKKSWQKSFVCINFCKAVF